MLKFRIDRHIIRKFKHCKIASIFASFTFIWKQDHKTKQLSVVVTKLMFYNAVLKDIALHLDRE